MINKDYLYFALACLAIFLFTVLLHSNTFCGMDSDFQAYALYSKQIFNGQTPYVDFFEHKPPLYMCMLIPGNFLGGRLISFFVVQLFYVGLVNVLVFFSGVILSGNRSYSRGVWTWLLFSMLTIVQFFTGGNLNGSIIYVSAGFSLASFLFMLKVRYSTEEGQSAKALMSAAGFFCGLSFMTRFGIAVAFVFVLFLGYLLFCQKTKIKKLIILTLCYTTGFLLPVVLLPIILRIPFKELYDHLILFNSLYSRLHGDVAVFSQMRLRIWETINYLYGYAEIPVFICFAALICFIVSRFIVIANKSKLRLMDIFKIDHRFKSFVVCWMFLYFLAELFMISLQGVGSKNYPYFAVFVPLCLLASFSLDYLATKIRFPQWLISLVLVIVFLELFSTALHETKGWLRKTAKWPESELISSIKKHIDHKYDFFTLDYQAYIYLETGTTPPIPRTCYTEWWWSFLSTRPQLHEKLWEQLDTCAPSVVTRQSNITMSSPVKTFLSNYDQIGVYPTTYNRRGKTILYLRKDSSGDK